MAGDGDLRWGIIGTGGIAGQFVADLLLTSSGQAVAVGSRSVDRGGEFAREHGIATAYGSYEALVADERVEAVYVAVPNPFHHDCARLALEAGKAVLVEKPFTMDAAEAHDLVTLAGERGLFLMEGMWTRCLPHVRHIEELIGEGRLGEVRLVLAELGFAAPRDASHRLYNPSLGGGALLDLGVYLLWLASTALGRPSVVHAEATFGFTGVDAQTSMVLEHASGAQAMLAATLEAALANRAVIAGCDGRIEVEGIWFRPTAFSLVERSGARERFDHSLKGSGLRFEAEEVARCVRDGLLQSPRVPLADTLAIMATMDEMRRQIGLTYPSTEL